MLGWLHVVPEGEKQTRAQAANWPLPDCGKWLYLASWFLELRLRFDYKDIESWMKITGSAPSPGEIDLLMMMSGVYISSLNDYPDKSHDLVPPYDGR